MLRVSVNGFMESLGVVLGVMRELDVESFEGREVLGEEEGKVEDVERGTTRMD